MVKIFYLKKWEHSRANKKSWDALINHGKSYAKICVVV